MKRVLSCILALAVLFSLTACGKKTEADLTDAISATGQWLLDKVAEPAYGTVGGEWLVMGLAILSDRQNENGGYQFNENEQASCESVAQVMVALAELGFKLDDDRFVKNGKTLLDGLMQFQQADGGFSHLVGGESDLLATEQAFYALVAADRMERGGPSLYRMK